jgi:DNA-binding response OmpR family regulator
MANVLIVDDDAPVCAALTLALGGLGHAASSAPDGVSALNRISDGGGIDVVVLDVMMPGLDGFETCRRIRSRSQVPVIMLTARFDPVDIVVGLECGADDYVVKPVEPRVLDARMKAVLRRATPDNFDRVPASAATFGDLRIDRGGMKVTKSGRRLELTPTELRLLLEFANHPGQAMTRQSLLDRVWEYGYLGDSRIVDACVQRLRAKVEDEPAKPRWIVTVRGVGYRFDA